MAIKIKVTGGDELEKALNRLRSRGRDGIGEAVMTGAFIIEGAAKSYAPVDTGALRSSINATLVSSIGTTAEAEISPDVHYAGYVEFGTYRMPAQPYMRPAADNHQRKIESAVRATLAQAIGSV